MEYKVIDIEDSPIEEQTCEYCNNQAFSTCEKCDKPYCEEHKAPCTYHNFIDYDCCSKCYQTMIENGPQD